MSLVQPTPAPMAMVEQIKVAMPPGDEKMRFAAGAFLFVNKAAPNGGENNFAAELFSF
jgi:hypothetical protein